VSQRASGLIGEDSMVAEELSQLYIDLMLALEVRPPVRIQCGATHALTLTSAAALAGANPAGNGSGCGTDLRCRASAHLAADLALACERSEAYRCGVG
jgi:hypothetical protein